MATKKLKFKVGDEVRIVSDINNEHLLKTATIKSRQKGSYPYELDGVDSNPWMEEELEFEAVYNSPLYKALS